LELEYIRRGALLHDIGLMEVPETILMKPGALDEDEWEVVRSHPSFAHEMLSPIPALEPVLEIPYHHHERWDGSGYPLGLAGEEIPLSARIFAVVDVWDALRRDRPDRRGWSEEEVDNYLREKAGEEFDPKVVEAFLGLEHLHDAVEIEANEAS
jgi:HD-GYP domain-containing protein (c-di-GMP phosphodiesterase class II)